MKPEGRQPERSGSPAPNETGPHPATTSLWERFLSRQNLVEALRRVEHNAGAPGIDGMSTKALRPWLKEHWPELRAQLDAGTYRPAPTRRVTIPRPSGSERKLGVPTAKKGFNEPYGRFRDAVRTARCGPARRVVWEGPG